MRSVIAALAVLVLGCGGPVKAPPAPESAREFYARLVSSTVQVWVSCPGGAAGSGSGVVVRNTAGSSYVATAAHVAHSLTCLQKVDAGACVVTAQDETADVAILKCRPLHRPAVEVGEVYLGESATAVGFPHQLQTDKTGLQITTGNVSALFDKRFKFTSPIYFGNSGGPLFDAQGRLLGLTVSCIVSGQSEWGFLVPMPGEYFATPAARIFELLPKE